jgi:predicted O-methyltransferase YrrM
MAFEGVTYRTAENWLSALPAPTAPIRYLEIGTFYGANLFSVGRTYANHPESRMVCIDPWTDYSDYSEYKSEQPSIYDTFQRNLEASGQKEKITVVRGFSHSEVPKLEDDSFDIIYIDGNHEPEYVCEDAVLAFRKLKVGGTMIFDDYGWGGPNLTQRGIDGFRSAYHKRLNARHPCVDSQVFVQKTR